MAFVSNASSLVSGDTNGRERHVPAGDDAGGARPHAPVGTTDGGTTLQILGDGFTAGATVTIGGVAAASVTVVDATRIDVVTPPHAAGLVDVAVVVPGFDGERLAYAFTYEPLAPE